MQLLQHIEPVLVRHGEIEQHDVTRFAQDDSHRFLTITGFCSYSHARVLGNDAFQAFSNNSVIIYDTYFNHLARGYVRRAGFPLPGSEEMLRAIVPSPNSKSCASLRCINRILFEYHLPLRSSTSFLKNFQVMCPSSTAGKS